MNYIGIIRNNWKKSTLAAFAAVYGAISLKSHYEATEHMRLLCNTIESKWSGQTPKRVLVVLNPMANKKKAEKKFRKYCEPILHLAGYSVEVLKTNHVGHAKTYVENIKRLPDAIVVAGGDGTSSEVITGLMRRNETPCPIAILPLGQRNETARKYLNYNYESDLDYIRVISNALVPMLQERVKFENVIQYDVIENHDDINSDSSNTTLKPIYGLSRLSWGVLKDIDLAKDNYWYFGYFRHYAAALLKSFSSNLNWNFKTDYIYTPPCSGCSHCFVNAKTPPAKSTSFLNKLISNKSTASQPLELSISNEHCSTKVQGHIETNQLTIVCNRNEENFFQLESEFVNSLEPGWDFIKNIPKITRNDIQPTIVLRSRTIQLFPQLNANNIFYSIDGEEYDARPIKVSLVPKAIKMYC